MKRRKESSRLKFQIQARLNKSCEFRLFTLDAIHFLLAVIMATDLHELHSSNENKNKLFISLHKVSECKLSASSSLFQLNETLTGSEFKFHSRALHNCVRDKNVKAFASVCTKDNRCQNYIMMH